MQTGKPTTMRASNTRKAHEALRKAGLHQVTIWMPDTTRAGFTEECRRQSLLLQGDAHKLVILNQLAALSGTEGWQ